MIWLKSLFWPLKQMDAVLPTKGLIVDLGCGDGVLTAHLAQHHPQRQVLGVDSNTNKLALARHRYRAPNLTFKLADVRQVNLKQASACILSDVLHHLSPASQNQLLEKISHQLKPGVTCLIKEVDKSSMVRSKLTRLWDWLLYPHDQIHFLAAADLINTMKKLKFTVKFTPITPWFPGSVNLFICTKLL